MIDPTKPEYPSIPAKTIGGQIHYWRENDEWHLGLTGPDWLLDDLKAELTQSATPILLFERHLDTGVYLNTSNLGPTSLGSGGYSGSPSIPLKTQITRLLELSFPKGDGIRNTDTPHSWPLGMPEIDSILNWKDGEIVEQTITTTRRNPYAVR